METTRSASECSPEPRALARAAPRTPYSRIDSNHRAPGTTSGRETDRYRRRGVGYVYFLSTTMLLFVVGLSALMMARIQRRTAQGGDDAMVARFYAQSAIELGFAKIQQDPNWRTNLGSGAWFTNQPIGTGTLSLAVSILSDGDANPDNNPVRLVGTGVHGQATHKMEVTLGVLSAKGGLVPSLESWKRTVG